MRYVCMHVCTGVGTLVLWGGYEVRRLLVVLFLFLHWGIQELNSSHQAYTRTLTLSHCPTMYQILYLDNYFSCTCQLKTPLSGSIMECGVWNELWVPTLAGQLELQSSAPIFIKTQIRHTVANFCNRRWATKWPSLCELIKSGFVVNAISHILSKWSVTLFFP